MRVVCGGSLLDRVREDVRIMRERDPSISSTAEALLYPGLHVLLVHRAAHRLHAAGHPTLARAVGFAGRWWTGVEIHPAARIGRRVFIDHGGGVVIGQDVRIGDDVVIYQRVTLGSVGWRWGTGPPEGRRHPVIGDRVVLGAGAGVFGGVEVGAEARIGAHAVVTASVPPGARVPALGRFGARPSGGA
ncbi:MULTISPECIES: serine O-acetyltransferase EpsC [unclassified Streptomyces]|uniref:serine O-acetyltransferase EpsC n=1 Tax=unclassified Streptomyces TaxID=2593676 RepID=UPI001F5BB4CC|nr:serine O-acetyltransferase EpsC [Streptomyces sp. HSG2]